MPSSESEEKTSGSEYEVTSGSECESDNSDLESCRSKSTSPVADQKVRNRKCKSELPTQKLATDFEPSRTSKRTEESGTKKKKKANDITLDSSVASLDLSINLKPVGPVLQNGKNEVLKTSKDGAKKYICFYCFKKREKTENPNIKIYFSKVVEHYESAHKDEDLIIELMKIPKEKIVLGQPLTENQKNRKKITESLNCIASFENNLQVTDVSNFALPRRAQEDSGNTVANYGNCFKCKKPLSLTSIHKHVRNCTGLSFKKKRSVKSSSRATMGNYHPIGTETARMIISKVNEDDILDQIRHDYAIFLWLNTEASKAEAAPQRHPKIRANLRRLGNFLKFIKMLNNDIEELSDVFHEDNYSHFIEACKLMGKADPTTKFFKSAATASDMSHLIKSVANVYHVELGAGQKQKREEIDAFLKKVTILWHSSIGNTIAESQAKNKRNKLITLPSQDDMARLIQYLEQEMIKAYNALKVKYTDEMYVKLSNSIESYLHVTNCRRAGEVEKLNLEDFNAIQLSGDDCRIQVRGKRMKPVPIIFKKQIYKYLQLLIKYRREAKIHKKNPYIFSNIHDVLKEYTFVSACSLMNKFSNLCGAENPETLRGTLFRMHLATTAEEKGINEQGVEKLSSFMGHTPRIHIQNYRQSVFKRDVSISNLVRETQTSKKNQNLLVDAAQEDESNVSIDAAQEDESNESIDVAENENNGNLMNCSISSGKIKIYTFNNNMNLIILI